MINNEVRISHIKQYYGISEALEVELEFSKDVSEFNFIKFQIGQVDAQSEYNNIICDLITDLSINTNGKILIKLKSSSLGKGLYFFCHLELLKQDKWNAEFPMKFDIYDAEQIRQSYFKIGDQDKIENYSSILTQVTKIYNDRKKEFLKGVGNCNLETFYSVFFFIKNVYLSKRFTYGQCEVIPFEKISTSNIYEFINNFLLKEVGVDVGIEYDNNDRIQYENPGLVIFYPKVFAITEVEAREIGERITNNLLKAFSLTRNTQGEIISSIIFDTINMKFFFDKPQVYTARNIMHGERVGENPFLNQEVVELTIKDHIFSLLINLYNDTINETHVEIKYSKLWTILEVLAESKNYPDKVLKKNYLDGEKFHTQKESNKPTIKDKVRELFRENFAINDFLKKLLIHPSESLRVVDDMLTVWYRHRNCMVHCGGCQPDNPSICKDKPDYTLCKSKHINILNTAPNRNVHNDKYLHLLESGTRCLLINYFIQKTGFRDIDINFFSQVSVVPSVKLEERRLERIGGLKDLVRV